MSSPISLFLERILFSSWFKRSRMCLLAFRWCFNWSIRSFRVSSRLKHSSCNESEIIWRRKFYVYFQYHSFSEIYRQTWANDHLRITTTCLWRPILWRPVFNFILQIYLWAMTTCQQRHLFLGLKSGRCTLSFYFCKCQSHV